MRVLVADDDALLRRLLVRGLSEEGFAVDEAGDGEDAHFKAADPAYDLIILDLKLPKMDGLSLLRELRAKELTTPVLVITGHDSIANRIRSLDSGADDYLAKPVGFEELLAHTRALLRRPRTIFDPVLRVGPLTLDRLSRQAHWQNRRIDLSVREFGILEYLMQHAGEVLSRTRIYEHVWSEQIETMSNVIDVHIKCIRHKLARAGSKGVISTVRGAGYRLDKPPA